MIKMLMTEIRNFVIQSVILYAMIVHLSLGV
jgi:hypothetical protein